MYQNIEDRRAYGRNRYQLNKEEERRKDRAYYAKNREKILLRLKNRRDENTTISNKGKIVEHHIKYKEIHGVDKTIWIPKGEHTQLHHRLRQEGKCNIPVEELNRISQRAKNRTTKYKERRKTIQFTETIQPHIQLVEEISYDLKSGHVYCRGRFRANYGFKLLNIVI